MNVQLPPLSAPCLMYFRNATNYLVYLLQSVPDSANNQASPRLRARRCGEADWVPLKRAAVLWAGLLTSSLLQLRFLKKFHGTPIDMNQQLFWCIFCSQ